MNGKDLASEMCPLTPCSGVCARVFGTCVSVCAQHSCICSRAIIMLLFTFAYRIH